MDLSQGFIDPSTGFFFSNGGNCYHQRLQSGPISMPSSAFISQLAQQQQSQSQPLVSTGLRLAFEDRNQQLAAQQDQEMDRFIVAQGEQLRGALAETRRRHEQTLLSAAESSAAARRLKWKEMELQFQSKRAAELQERVAQVRAEILALQAKATADQAAAAALRAHLQRVSLEDELGLATAAEDAESAYVSPERTERERPCRACRERPATVVLLPCRHLCLCSDCDAAAYGGARACPVCRCVGTASVQVILS